MSRINAHNSRIDTGQHKLTHKAATTEIICTFSHELQNEFHLRNEGRLRVCYGRMAGGVETRANDPHFLYLHLCLFLCTINI